MSNLLNKVLLLEAQAQSMVEYAKAIRLELERDGAKKKKPQFDTSEFLAQRRKSLLKNKP